MRLFFIVMIIGLLTAASTWAGRETGNGTDDVPSDLDAAWFLGAGHEIKYCYELAPDFGVSAEKIEQTIAQAYSIWEKYLYDKKAMQVYPSPDWDVLKFATRVRPLAKCDGTQDLKFYFGTSDATVEQYRRQYARPIAFAQRLSWNAYEGWGSGFIWVSQDVPYHFNWGASDRLLGVLLHEIGHSFGNGHVDRTIMDSNLLFLLAQADDYPGRWKLHSIDWELELKVCDTCAYAYDGRVGYNPSHPEEEEREARDLFALLGSRAAKGHVKARLVQSDGQPLYNALMLSDDAGSLLLKIHFADSSSDGQADQPPGATRISRGGPVFKREKSTPNQPGDPADSSRVGYGSVDASETIIDFGNVVTASGETVGILRSRNADTSSFVLGPVSLRLIRGGKIHNLFHAVVDGSL